MKWCGRRAICLWHKKKVVCMQQRMQQSSAILPKETQIIAPPYRTAQQLFSSPLQATESLFESSI
eukprot:15365671-Ditylum_brightwellii.AAC.1